jgi:hypothetical protein
MKTRQGLYGALGAIFLTMLGGCGSGSGGDSRNYNTLGGGIAMSLVNTPSGAVTGLQLYDGEETYDVTLPAKTSGSVPFSFPTALSQGTAAMRTKTSFQFYGTGHSPGDISMFVSCCVRSDLLGTRRRWTRLLLRER